MSDSEEKRGCLNCKNLAHTVGTFGGICKLRGGHLIAPLYGSPESRFVAEHGLDICADWEEESRLVSFWRRIKHE